MPSSIARMLMRSAQAAQSLVSQVVVSVAAAVCVALITNAYLEPKPPEPDARMPPRVETAAPPQSAAPAGTTVAPKTARADRAEPAQPAAERAARLPALDRVVVGKVPEPVPARPAAAPSHGSEIFPELVEDRRTAGEPLPLLQPAREPERLSGLALPRLVPGAGAVLRSVGSATDRLLAVVPGLGRDQAQ